MVNHRSDYAKITAVDHGKEGALVPGCGVDDAASAKGTVSPSDIPITMSLTISEPVK